MSMGSVANEKNVPGDIVLWETGVSAYYCRAQGATVTVGAGAAVEAGQILEGGAPYIPLAVAGNANAVLLRRLHNSTAGSVDMPAVVMDKGPSIVNQDQLIGIAGAAPVAASLDALTALQILQRTEPAVKGKIGEWSQ